MKRLLWFLLASAALLCGQSLSDVHSVYFLPMSRGLDQYLANRLTTEHVLQVVTDPKLADAVFTDRIGSAFEDKVAELFPKPPARAAASNEPASKEPKNRDTSDKESADNPTQPGSSGAGDTTNKLSNPANNSSFGRNKGMVFLVDPKSRHVLWSDFQPSKDTSSRQLDRTASDIVSRLKRDLKAK